MDQSLLKFCISTSSSWNILYIYVYGVKRLNVSVRLADAVSIARWVTIAESGLAVSNYLVASKYLRQVHLQYQETASNRNSHLSSYQSSTHDFGFARVSGLRAMPFARCSTSVVEQYQNNIWRYKRFKPNWHHNVSPEHYKANDIISRVLVKWLLHRFIIVTFYFFVTTASKKSAEVLVKEIGNHFWLHPYYGEVNHR